MLRREERHCLSLRLRRLSAKDWCLYLWCCSREKSWLAGEIKKIEDEYLEEEEVRSVGRSRRRTCRGCFNCRLTPPASGCCQDVDEGLDISSTVELVASLVRQHHIKLALPSLGISAFAAFACGSTVFVVPNMMIVAGRTRWIERRTARSRSRCQL